MPKKTEIELLKLIRDNERRLDIILVGLKTINKTMDVEIRYMKKKLDKLEKDFDKHKFNFNAHQV